MVTILRDAIAEQTAIGSGSGIDGRQNSDPAEIGRPPALIEAD